MAFLVVLCFCCFEESEQKVRPSCSIGSEEEIVCGLSPFLCCPEKWSRLNRISHPHWVKICDDHNGQINLRAKQKKRSSFCYRSFYSLKGVESDTLEERNAIKFCFMFGKNSTETYGILQTAFGASCMNRASVFEWHKRFKEARVSVRDD